MDPLPYPYGNAIHSTHTYLVYFRLSLVYELATQKSFTVDTAIRIDHVNPAGGTSSYTLSPLTVVYTTCTRQPSSGSPTWVSATTYLIT